ALAAPTPPGMYDVLSPNRHRPADAGGSAVLDAPQGPRANLEPFLRDRLAAHLAPAVAAVGHALSGPLHVLEHLEQLLLRRDGGEAVDRERGPLTDTLAERDLPDLTGRLGQFGELRLQPLLPLSQEAVDVCTHVVMICRVRRALPRQPCRA